jgi:predicted site-specific integrase-resolvase
MPVLQRSKIITLAEACEILGISYSYGCHTYHLWPDQGVRILKHAANARPKFYDEDIYKMMETKK